MSAASAPLILTLQITSKHQAYFNALRERHFPHHLNYLDAHLTLFHALPNTTAVVEEIVEQATATQALLLQVTGAVSLGKGVAFKIESAPLKTLHRKLQASWSPFLTSQDRQGLWPHITVQNKVSPAEASALLTDLKQSFVPFTTQAIGLQLWAYLNGPWQHLLTFPFRRAQTMNVRQGE